MFIHSFFLAFSAAHLTRCYCSSAHGTTLMQALSEMQLQQHHGRARLVCAVFLALALLPRRELAQAIKCDTSHRSEPTILSSCHSGRRSDG